MLWERSTRGSSQELGAGAIGREKKKKAHKLREGKEQNPENCQNSEAGLKIKIK